MAGLGKSRLVVHPQLGGDVLEVDTTLMQCFNHHEVLLTQHAYLLELVCS